MTGAVGAGLAVAGCASGAPDAEPSTRRRSTESTRVSTAVSAEQVAVEDLRSAERGQVVRLVIIRPEGVTGRLPVCLALHGRDRNAEMFVDLGGPAALTELVNGGAPPFAIAAVDGGNYYWVKRESDDPQRMLTEEVPGWLGERNLATTPFSVLGISMGAYGALNYAKQESRPAVATISPALFLNWTQAAQRNAFLSQDIWASTDPLQHMDEVGGALGLWCGTRDPFYPAAQQLQQLADPKVAEFGDADHEEQYWRDTLPEALSFVANSIT